MNTPAGTYGPWGFIPSPMLALPKPQLAGLGAADITPVDWLDYAGKGLNQKNLAACGAFAYARKFTAWIRRDLGLGAMPWDYAINPLPPWKSAKIHDGAKPTDNVGVKSAASVLWAMRELGILPQDATWTGIGNDVALFNEALKGQPMPIAFACHDGFFPKNLAPNGAVAENMGPNALDFAMRGHLCNCIGLVHSAEPGDSKPIVYDDETWGPEVGFEGFSFCHLEEKWQCMLEGCFVVSAVDWKAHGGWQAHVASYAEIELQQANDH